MVLLIVEVLLMLECQPVIVQVNAIFQVLKFRMRYTLIFLLIAHILEVRFHH